MERLIEEFHLTDKMNWRIKELSTGEAQRASVARALALKPDLLIADSPTSLLDEDSAAKVVECLKDYHLRGGTVLAASNDPRIVRLARQVLFLDHGTLVPTPRG
jgi:ABC-type lipoprotein export system ATPase subunit